MLHAYLFFTQTILILSLHSGTGQVVSRKVISRLLLATTAAAAATATTAAASQRQWPAYRPVKFVVSCQCSAASTPAKQRGPLQSGQDVTTRLLLITRRRKAGEEECHHLLQLLLNQYNHSVR